MRRWAYHGTKAPLETIREEGLRLFKPSDVLSYGTAPRIWFFTEEKRAQSWAGRTGYVLRWKMPKDAKSHGDGVNDDWYQWETRTPVPPEELEIRNDLGHWEPLMSKRSNPLPEVDVPRDFDRAVDGYRTFHTGPAWVSKGTRDPRQIGQFPGLVWPKKCCIVGKANHVMYRSDKWETKKHDYIHEHEAGVVVALFDSELDLHDDVPKFVLEAETVYLLGDCLGFEGETDDGEIIEAVGGKGDELYAIPSNRALIVINTSGRVARVEAMIWGGNLNVIDRGIIG